MKITFCITIIALLLTSCSTKTTQTVIESKQKIVQQAITKKENKPTDCRSVINGVVQYVSKPIVTGIERYKLVKLIERKLFIERLKASLGDFIDDKYFDERDDFGLSKLNGLIQIRSNSTHILKVHYSTLDLNKRTPYGHQLLEADKLAMTEVINLIIGDKQKSAEILNQLYQQYMEKVKKNEVLNNGETLHSYVEYNGILFQMWGMNRTTHLKKECNRNMLTGLTIE